METTTTTTPFDLNQALLQWRESLQQSPVFCRENLEELESHLRDSIASLKQRGLAEDEAFLIAARRAGSGTALGAEYGKINSREIWLNRAMWMLIGTLFFDFVTFPKLPVSVFIMSLSFRSFNSMSVAFWYQGMLNVLASLLSLAIALGVGWWLLMRKGNRISVWLRKAPSRSVRWVVVGVGLIYVLPHVIWSMFFSPHTPLQMINYGVWLMQSTILFVLTLLLARRQLLAKTCA